MPERNETPTRDAASGAAVNSHRAEPTGETPASDSAARGSHTPGRMFIRRATHPIDGEYDVALFMNIGGRDYVVAEAFGRVAEDVRPPADANARRLAACWNALRHLTTDEIEAFDPDALAWLLAESKVATGKRRST